MRRRARNGSRRPPRSAKPARSIGLLRLERKNSGMEVGRIAGELAQIGREVGAQQVPLLSALLANRSGVLQRIAAEMVASAATLASWPRRSTRPGCGVGALGAAEVDEGTARLAAASLLAAHAADVGARVQQQQRTRSSPIEAINASNRQMRPISQSARSAS